MAQEQRFQSLQAGRGVAALAIVWLHSAGMLQKKELWANSWYFDRFCGFALGISYFFVLSGVVIFLAHWRDLGLPRAAFGYLFKRARRIYPIYWFALILWWLLYARHLVLPLHVYLDNLFLVRTGEYAKPLLPVSWTLYHEVFFYISFLAVILHKRLGWIVLAAWWLFAASRYQSSEPDPTQVFSAVQLLFPLGLLGAYLIKKRKTPYPGFIALAGLVLLLLVVIVAGDVGVLTMGGYLIGGFASFLLIVGLAELEVQGRFRVPGALQFLGKASYSIYLFHFHAAVRLSRTFYRLSRHLPLPQPVWLCGIFLGSLAFGCAAYVLIEVPLMDRIGRWTAASKELRVG